MHFDEAAPEINIESVFRNMSLYLKNKYGATHYKRKVAEFAERTGIALNRRKLPDVTVVDDGTNGEELLVSKEEAEEDFRQKFNDALQADDNKWHIIKRF